MKKLTGLGFALVLLLSAFTLPSKADASADMTPKDQRAYGNSYTANWKVTWSATGSRDYYYVFNFGNGKSIPRTVNSLTYANVSHKYELPNGVKSEFWKPSVYVVDFNEKSYIIGTANGTVYLANY